VTWPLQSEKQLSSNPWLVGLQILKFWQRNKGPAVPWSGAYDQISSGIILMAPQGHSVAHMAQPLQ
jgi:hypothetical protein